MAILIGADTYGSSDTYGQSGGEGVGNDPDNKLAAGSSGTVTHLYTRWGTGSSLVGSVIIALYDSANNLLCKTGSISVSAGEWIGGAVDTPTAVTAAATYSIFVFPNNTGYLTLFNASGASTWTAGFVGPTTTPPDPLGSVTYDSNARPAVYAEDAGGSLPATLTTPTATSITQTTATIGCTSDTASGLVHAGVTTTATPPSDAQLIAGSGGGIVAAGSVSAVAGANTVGLTGLTADTGYFRHFIQSDGAGTATSTMLSPDETAGFTTLATNVGFRITGIQAPDGSGVGNVDPVSVAIWNNSAAAHGAAADTVVSDAAIASGTLEVAHAGTLTEDVLVDVQYSTGSPAVLRSVRGVATLIDLDA